MSLWELTACAEGVRRANNPPEPSKPKSPTPEEHYAALERIEAYGRSD